MLLLEHQQVFMLICGKQEELALAELKTSPIRFDDASFTEQANLESGADCVYYALPLLERQVQSVTGNAARFRCQNVTESHGRPPPVGARVAEADHHENEGHSSQNATATMK